MIARLILLTTILTTLGVIRCALPVLDETIGQAIFHEAQPYVVYVSDHPNESYLRVLEEYCGEEELCALLDSTGDMHRMISEFVRMDVHHYLLILDAESFQKYTLPLHEAITVEDIEQFYLKFKEGTLQRHFSSEEEPTQQNDPHLKKIVGRTFQEFVEGPESVKVLYLYSDSEGCSTCKEVYEVVSSAAVAFADRSQVSFGSFDLFRNEHMLLSELNIPVVLVYTSVEDKLRLVELQEINKLQQILTQKIPSPQNDEL